MIHLVALGQFHRLLAVIRLWSPMRVRRFRPANRRARLDGARQRWFRVWRPGQRGQTNLCAGAGRWRCAASRASCRLAGFGLRCATVPVSPGTPTGRAGECAEMAFAGSGHRPVSGAGEAADAPWGRQHLATASSSPVGSSRRGSARRDAARLVRPQNSSRSNTTSSAKIPRAGRCAGLVARTLPPTSGAVPTRIRIRSGQIVRQDSMRRRLCPRRPDFHVAGVPPDCRGTGSKGALRACLPEPRIPSATRWAFPSPAGVGHMDGGDPARVRAILEGPRTGDVPALGARFASRPREPACSRWRPFRSARPLACRNPKLAQSMHERPARQSSNRERDGAAVADGREILVAALRRSAIAGTGRVWFPPGRFPRRCSRVPP